MNYNKLLNLPDFNLQEESEDLCSLCGIAVPRELQFILPTFVGDSYKDLCPQCALGIRNLFKGYPKTAKFAGDEGNNLYFQFISWKEMKGL